MSFQQQYEQDLAMGCVCDFDVACPSHPRQTTPHDVCEYAGGCSLECPYLKLMGPSDDFEAAFKALKRKTHAQYRKAWMADYRRETGASKFEAELGFERMLNQSWAGCTCAACGNESAA